MESRLALQQFHTNLLIGKAKFGHSRPMTTKRILLFGGSGQIGQALRAEPLPAGWTLAAPPRAECDITDHSRMRDTVQAFKPDLIINSAAMTNIDQCQADLDAALAVNFEAAAALTAQCSANDVPLIQLSTDYVFDGQDGEVPYKPDDLMNPLNIYGQSKYMGEEAVRHDLPFHVILRVSAVFSAFGKNILTRVLETIEAGDEAKFPVGQKACPTYAPEIAKALITMTNAILGGKSNGFGIFHFCGEGPANRLEFAQSVMDAYLPYTARRPKLLPATEPQAVPRPAYSVLDCRKILDIYGIAQKPWRDSLPLAIEALMQLEGRRKVA
jgi:dTDP-4-dehydrorhamnose reductase